ncbi:hypothetical protein BJ742DRAFT_772813 [Cladochytrium replicatum]|nr:hypothetical protein BJ742DRAFT_772813 [Cladochytrium replicatum]
MPIALSDEEWREKTQRICTSLSSFSIDTHVQGSKRQFFKRSSVLHIFLGKSFPEQSSVAIAKNELSFELLKKTPELWNARQLDPPLTRQERTARRAESEARREVVPKRDAKDRVVGLVGPGVLAFGGVWKSIIASGIGYVIRISFALLLPSKKNMPGHALGRQKSRRMRSSGRTPSPKRSSHAPGLLGRRNNSTLGNLRYVDLESLVSTCGSSGIRWYHPMRLPQYFSSFTRSPTLCAEFERGLNPILYDSRALADIDEILVETSYKFFFGGAESTGLERSCLDAI